MKPTTSIAVLFAIAALAAGCGNDEDVEPASAGDPPATTQLTPEIDPNKDPREITCRDLADELASARLSRVAGYTLADEALENDPGLVRKTNRNLLAQQIYFGMTELCKDERPGYTPAEAAVEGTQSGRYVGD